MRSIKISLLLAAILVMSFCVGITSQAVSINARDDMSSTAEADLGRVIWQGEQYPNPGFEIWADETPSYLRHVSNYAPQERYTNYVSAPWPVSEGSRSYVLQARTDLPWTQYPEARLTRSQWISWDNPTNLTLKLDWYLDQIGNPTDGDIFELRVYLRAPGERQLHYYFGCQSTTLTNSSWRAYFFIDGALDTWHTLDRNITADHYEVFGDYPTQFRYFHVAAMGTTPDYVRGFVDDIQMVNSTWTVIGGSTENGDFESSAAWYQETDYDPAFHSQSTDWIEGDYSLNTTVTSKGNRSEVRVSTNLDRWVSELNPDTFTFSWKLEDLAVSDISTYAYVSVSCSNGTDDYYLYYMLTYGDTFFVGSGNSQVIQVTGFNTTGQWYNFSRSVWTDVSSAFDVENLRIEEIEITNYARVENARTVLLIDGISMTTGIMSDMSYETQGEPGDLVYAWKDAEPEFTVTDFAHTGAKGANLTVVDGGSLYLDQDFGFIPVDDTTDLWIDLFWYLDENSEDPGNEVYMEFEFFSLELWEYYTLAYFLVNTTPIASENGFDAYVLLDDANVEGTWHNMQRNLYVDFVAAFGEPTDVRLNSLYVDAEATSGGRVELLFDDVYIYTDPEPAIADVTHLPVEPILGEEVIVNASVYDPSLDSVVLYYRVDNGSWLDIGMTLGGDVYSASIPSQSLGATVEYYVEATDSFGNVARSSTSIYSVAQAPPPTPIIPPLVGLGVVVVVAIVIALLLYLFYFKPRQTAE
ncbi:hypothetical protein EU546_07870 [Candidatus Thorarchaeota archaeon]|nr:MAG: hypothetical protein EU546_07870 [Candidatus Thorarchaeota archaeon]